MLTDNQIQNNKEEFLKLISSINREGFNKDLLLKHLENSDFYIAPASARYHSAFKGGLVHHSLLVYHNLTKLVGLYNLKINEDSMKIVSLLHDLAKMNFYEVYYKNVKVYSENGYKYDNGGRFDWQAVADYKVKDTKERFLYYNHEGTSEFMLRQYCPLSMDESIAILHHHGGMSEDSIKDNISAIYDRYPLAVLLHLADMMSVYIDESTNKE